MKADKAQCMICKSHCHYYFSKTYTESPYDGFMRDIGPVDYFRCSECGFVFSRTHQELSCGAWEKLNRQFHHFLEDPASEKKNNQPPYAEQGMMLNLLARNRVISRASMLDYAGGFGTLSRILRKYYDIELPICDPFVRADDLANYVEIGNLETYDTVISSAMFEHVLRRSDLDNVNRLVRADGCLIVHTVICENIPKDPNWFYLLPVHTAFHTNKSMNVLMNQWGYTCSIYSPRSKSWVLLRRSIDDMSETVKKLNRELQADWFYCKSGFVDYWKGFLR